MAFVAFLTSGSLLLVALLEGASMVPGEVLVRFREESPPGQALAAPGPTGPGSSAARLETLRGVVHDRFATLEPSLTPTVLASGSWVQLRADLGSVLQRQVEAARECEAIATIDATPSASDPRAELRVTKAGASAGSAGSADWADCFSLPLRVVGSSPGQARVHIRIDWNGYTQQLAELLAEHPDVEEAQPVFLMGAFGTE